MGNPRDEAARAVPHPRHRLLDKRGEPIVGEALALFSFFRRRPC